MTDRPDLEARCEAVERLYMSAQENVTRLNERVATLEERIRNYERHVEREIDPKLRDRIATLEADRDKFKRAHEVAAAFCNDKLIPRAEAAEKHVVTLEAELVKEREALKREQADAQMIRFRADAEKVSREVAERDRVEAREYAKKLREAWIEWMESVGYNAVEIARIVPGSGEVGAQSSE